jgi:hypothetical protein
LPKPAIGPAARPRFMADQIITFKVERGWPTPEASG